MRLELLFGTHAGLHAAEINGDLDEIAVERIDDGHWTGLTRLSKSYLGFRREPYGENRHGWSDAYAIAEMSNGAWEVSPFAWPVLRGLDGVHQVAAGDGGLYVLETGANRLLHYYYVASDSAWHEHLFSGTAFDINHPNSIVRTGSGTVLVLLHNRSYGPSEIAQLQMQPEGRGFDVQGAFQLPHDHAHEIYVENPERIVYLASTAGDIVRIGPGGDIKKSAHVGGYVKGLVRTEISGDPVFILGSNERAERKDRPDTEAEIVVVDAESFSERARFSAAPERHAYDDAAPIENPASGNLNDLILR